LTALVALSTTAQVKFDEPLKIGKPERVKLKKETSVQKTANVSGDNSYYYWENNSRYTFELNTYLNDTPPAQGGTGFDTLGLYSYTVKQKVSSGGDTYWQELIQGIPTKANLTLNSLRFLGKALNTNGSNVNVSVYTKDLGTVLGSKDVAFTTNYNWQTVTFDSPVTSNDTMLVVLTMKTAGDSVSVAHSHNYFNGVDLLQSGTAYQTALPFTGDAAILAVSQNNAGILGLIRDNFDFFIVPNFSYDVTANFSASVTSLCEDSDVTFTNAGDTNHVYNPILNWIAWDYLANGNAPVYTMFDYEGNSTLDYQAGQVGTYTYANVGTFTAVASVISWPWSATSMLQDDQTFTITVDDCANINEVEANVFTVYPNPANDVVNVSLKNANGTISLIAADGKVIESREVSSTTETFNVRSLNAGVYFIQVGQSVQKLMVK